MALVGKSYLSVLLSLGLLDQGRKVLLLDDERMGMDEFYAERFFSLEKEYLVCWGQEQKIEPLLNVDRYLTNVSSKFIFDDVHVCLGGSPARNYRELNRKMPEVFSSPDDAMNVCESTEGMEEFNEIYFEYCNNLGKLIYSYKNINASGLSILLEQCPPVLKNIYHSFDRAFQNRKYDKVWWKLKILLYMSQGVFQKKLSLEPSPLERFHLFLCLLSPFYELNQKDFFEDLIQVNLKKGGQFKKTSIREWLFCKGRPWSVELASYEGIIHPKKMAFVGGIPQGNLVSLKPDVECYTSLDVELEFLEPPTKGWLHERIIFSGTQKLGSFSPLWEGTLDENRAVFKFIIFVERGRKVDFIKKKVERHLFHDLEQIIPKISKNIRDIKMTYGRDIWIDKTKSTAKNTSSSVGLMDFSRPEKRTDLKGVYYFGPYRETLFGSLGILMEINKQQQFL